MAEVSVSSLLGTTDVAQLTSLPLSTELFLINQSGTDFKIAANIIGFETDYANWTPTIVTDTGDHTVTFEASSGQIGYYVRLSTIYWCFGRLQFASWSVGTATEVAIDGFPVTLNGTTSQSGGNFTEWENVNLSTNSQGLGLIADVSWNGNSDVFVIHETIDGTTPAPALPASAFSATSELTFVICGRVP